jgi:protein deglycase
VKKVLLFLANGFEVYEASIIIDVIGWNLVHGDKTTELITCGIRKKIKSAFNLKFATDLTIDEVKVDEYEALIIPGGFEIYGFYEDAYNEKLLEMIREFHRNNKIIASICVGALPVGKSGILKGKKGTTLFVRQGHLRENGVVVLKEPVVFDDNIITSLNPATATDVAFKLLELLTSKEKSDYIKEIMGFNR